LIAVNRTAMAERMLADMQKLLAVHPRAVPVLCSRAIFDDKPKSPDDSGVGNLDYNDQAVDFDVPAQIKMLEITQDQKAKLQLSSGTGLSGEMDEPLLVLLSEQVPEQSIVTVFELDGDDVKEQIFIVMESQGIGRNSKGGAIYQLIPYRDTNEALEQVIDQEIEQITGDPVVDVVEPVSGNGFVFGE